jgi:hypothetical protein
MLERFLVDFDFVFDFLDFLDFCVEGASFFLIEFVRLIDYVRLIDVVDVN